MIKTLCIANIAADKRKTIHGRAQLDPSGRPVLTDQAIDVRSVRIVNDHGAIYLLRLDSLGETIADTWHPTLVDAKLQADFEYEIDEDQWQVL